EEPPADEFALLEATAAEHGLEWRGRPAVERRYVEVAGGRRLGAVVWGAPGSAEVVLLHGGMQSAHTWDAVALCLGRPAVAVDLAGHGRSDPVDWLFEPRAHVDDLAVAIAALAPSARLVAGMSLGGLSAACLAARRPSMVAELVLVDITPGVVPGGRRNPAMDELLGVASFASFGEALDRVAAANPSRSRRALRLGLAHNLRRREDGRWEWRAAHRAVPARRQVGEPPYLALWEDLGRVACPLTVVLGARSGVVSDADLTELRRRQPTARVVVVEGAGHSVQGSRPAALAAILLELLDPMAVDGACGATERRTED
ncbi:MAG: alpha/beta fold hydrolase, partial [Acidimicrobiales bacterium]